MITKYYEFLNNEYNIDLILESNIIYSDDFKRILGIINDKISKMVLGIENDDIDTISNYFDIIKDKNDTISFLPDKKAKTMLGENEKIVVHNGRRSGKLKQNPDNKYIFDNLGYDDYVEGKSSYSPNPTDIGEIISKTVTKFDNIYYWVKFNDSNGNPVGQGVYNSEVISPFSDKNNELWTKNRQEIKIGRVVRALLKSANKDFETKDIEVFVNKYKSTMDMINDKFFNFEIVNGNDIAYWYNYKNYYRRSGTLGSSCMSDVSDYYFDIYTQNTNQVSLVILKSENDKTKIVGRSLLWKLKDNKMFLDRIYTIEDSDVNLFREYAKKMGWYYKYYNSSTNNNSCYAPDGEIVHIDISLKLENYGMTNFPYLDTLKYFDSYDGTLTYKSGNGRWLLEDTGGDYIHECELCGGDGQVTCYNCEGIGTVRCNECDGNGNLECQECGGDGYEECPECGGKGENDEGEECSHCSGEGRISCSECDGDGYVECPECGGRGENECGECGGDGCIDCPECR